MKKSNFQPKKLTKKELKKISGGARPVCPRVVSCIDPATGDELYGVFGVQDGYCC
ncbi:bacteriocin [Chryseobacterium antibioticum]|uniref:Bacteriocin n=1 Tax=Chryseobacterium pyrolae TaxID=2987481 RepID=A0ABT2IJ64_9FLAO|nr:bacteriocin [Chryseobacterium pyrolae]MCT2408661.1 bacteriocin [Chryseobacterium pyrolae]